MEQIDLKLYSIGHVFVKQVNNQFCRVPLNYIYINNLYIIKYTFITNLIIITISLKLKYMFL